MDRDIATVGEGNYDQLEFISTRQCPLITVRWRINSGVLVYKTDVVNCPANRFFKSDYKVHVDIKTGMIEC